MDAEHGRKLLIRLVDMEPGGLNLPHVRIVFARLCREARGDKWLSQPIAEGTKVRPLEIACAIGALETTVDRLLSCRDLDLLSPASVLAAGYCAQRSDTRLLQRLADAGVPVCGFDTDGLTPLHRAVLGPAGPRASGRSACSALDAVWNPTGQLETDVYASKLELHAAYTAVDESPYQGVIGFLRARGSDWQARVLGNSPFEHLRGVSPLDLAARQAQIASQELRALERHSESEEAQYVVEVARTSSRTLSLTVSAGSLELAQERALAIAGDHDFTQGRSSEAQYEVVGIRPCAEVEYKHPRPHQ